MKYLLISIICFFCHIKNYAQQPYTQRKSIADSLFKCKIYIEAINTYQKIVNDSPKPRNDYYYIACSFSYLNKHDSAAFYIYKALKLGLKYNDLKLVDTDENLSIIRRYPEWKKIRKVISKNTKKYIKEKQKCKYPIIKKNLFKRKISDQKYRIIRYHLEWQKKQMDSINALQAIIDKENTTWLKSKITKYGWLGFKEVGEEGDAIAWLIVQHADLDTSFQIFALKLLKYQVEINNTNKSNFAYLTDRICVNTNQKQIYGTQFNSVVRDSIGSVIDAISRPIKDVEKLDSLRQSVGLPPFQKYKEQFIKHLNI